MCVTRHIEGVKSKLRKMNLEILVAKGQLGTEIIENLVAEMMHYKKGFGKSKMFIFFTDGQNKVTEYSY